MHPARPAPGELIQLPVNPVILTKGERKIGGTLRLDLSGTPAADVALFVSTSRLPAGFPVPGFGGLWFMGPLNLELLRAKLDGTGVFTLQVSIPNDPTAVAFPLHWQGAQAVGSAISLGHPATFGFYR